MGSNTYGQLGLGDKKLDLKQSPQLVESLVGQKAVKVACGSFHTLALNADGDCFAWGSNKFGQCGTQN
jgi:alpha-tubulin suppressor-like RCC1 family protein